MIGVCYSQAGGIEPNMPNMCSKEGDALGAYGSRPKLAWYLILQFFSDSLSEAPEGQKPITTKVRFLSRDWSNNKLLRSLLVCSVSLIECRVEFLAVVRVVLRRVIKVVRADHVKLFRPVVFHTSNRGANAMQG
jgi:hypothetical protein